MILRTLGLRQCRQAFAAPVRRSCLQQAALSTGDKRPPLRTTFANPPPPPAPEGFYRNEPAAPGASPSPSPSPSPSQPAPRNQQQDAQDPFVRPAAPPQTKLSSKHATAPVDQSIAKNYRKFVRMQSAIGSVGSEVLERFDPSSLLRDPPKPEDVTLELLMASQTHMGHHTSLWNPANQRYIYGARAGIHIISLEETAAALRRAARVIEEVAYLGGLMLFVGNRKGQMEVTARAAELAGACHLFSRWVPGTITNRDQILGQGGLHIVDEKDQPLQGFDSHLAERRPLMPELVVVLNPLENYTMLQECAQENIPTIGLIDTDADPTQVTYVIPGNDDSLRSVSVIAGVLGRAGERGQARRKADAAKGVCTWRNSPDIERWMEAENGKARTKAQGGAEGGGDGSRSIF
ncbi:37S ribosomal protein MRP4 [Diaporthe sp. PMI_573]|nr:37S ribosomal protein MRP4 [Diaporthaceae sp. PMI_573]